MNVRTLVGLLVAVPSLVAVMATPSDASSTGVVTFTGTLTITPQPTAVEVVRDVCFFGGATCANTAESSGTATGLGLDATSASTVDGLQATVAYTETCAGAAVLSPQGTAKIDASVHDVVRGSWSPKVAATWRRVGLVAVITGGATGAALFTPVEPMACGQPSDFAVVGAIELAY